MKLFHSRLQIERSQWESWNRKYRTDKLVQKNKPENRPNIMLMLAHNIGKDF